MKRRLFNLAAATSLLLCIAIGALWVRSQQSWAPDMILTYYVRWHGTNEVDQYYLGTESYGGTLSIELSRTHVYPSYFEDLSPQERQRKAADYPAGFRGKFIPRRIPYRGCSQQTGFAARHDVWSPTPAFRSENFLVTFRPWLPMALCAVLPVFWLNGFRKARFARRQGVCRKCGYDLRATPDRCPECGTVVPDPQNARMPSPLEARPT
jgi:hypothetical protein